MCWLIVNHHRPVRSAHLNPSFFWTWMSTLRYPPCFEYLFIFYHFSFLVSLPSINASTINSKGNLISLPPQAHASVMWLQNCTSASLVWHRAEVAALWRKRTSIHQSATDCRDLEQATPPLWPSSYWLYPPSCNAFMVKFWTTRLFGNDGHCHQWA